MTVINSVRLHVRKKEAERQLILHMATELTPIQGGRKSVKEFLQDLLNHLDEEYPRAADIVIVLASEPLPDDRNKVNYGVPSNGLSDERRLWMLRIAEEIVLLR